MIEMRKFMCEVCGQTYSLRKNALAGEREHISSKMKITDMKFHPKANKGVGFPDKILVQTNDGNKVAEYHLGRQGTTDTIASYSSPKASDFNFSDTDI